HWLVVDMGTSHPVGGFRYLPRQDGSSNGRIAGYRFYVSTNGVNWGTPVAEGTFANNSAEKTVTFGALPSNQPPVVTNPGNQSSVVGASVNLAIGASDPNGDTLSYSATGLPAGLSINAGTGVIYRPAAYHAARSEPRRRKLLMRRVVDFASEAAAV
ncbi:MAG: discoidin domain-containing protein, partial [Gammaproteobacteria bacterium]